MDKQIQAEFIDWLTEQLGAESPEQLQKELEEMGDEGIKKAYEMFNKTKTQQNTAAVMAKSGAKLENLKRLKSIKDGGKAPLGTKTVVWSKTNAIDENRHPDAKMKPAGSTTIRMGYKK